MNLVFVGSKGTKFTVEWRRFKIGGSRKAEKSLIQVKEKHKKKDFRVVFSEDGGAWLARICYGVFRR